MSDKFRLREGEQVRIIAPDEWVEFVHGQRDLLTEAEVAEYDDPESAVSGVADVPCTVNRSHDARECNGYHLDWSDV